jgi:dimethyl sulfoxide reductase iron-sulfur subunit
MSDTINEIGSGDDGSCPSWTRRRVLGGLGAAAGLTVAGGLPLTLIPNGKGSSQATTETKTAGAKRQWAFVIDLRRCDGCKACTAACQKTHYLPKDHEWIKVFTRVDDEGHKIYMPQLCNQCENPPCLKVCPTAATFKNPEGVVLVDQDKCIGCRMCMVACPYERRYFNYTAPPKPPGPFDNPMPEFPVPQQKGTVGKCILCVHYADKGRIPACVEACTMGALYIADLNADVMTNSSSETYQMSKYLYDNDAVRFKEELNTSPRVWYVAGHGQSLAF